MFLSRRGTTIPVILAKGDYRGVLADRPAETAPMDWQLIIVGVIVALAAAYLARAAWRTWTAARGKCGGGCGCAATTANSTKKNGAVTLIPAEQITLRRREQEPEA